MRIFELNNCLKCIIRLISVNFFKLIKIFKFCELILVLHFMEKTIGATISNPYFERRGNNI